jgi:hypothetical protein
MLYTTTEFAERVMASSAETVRDRFSALNVRFTPESGHRVEKLECLLCANSGH